MTSDQRVIMAGPRLDAPGGITAVVKTLLSEGSLQDFGVRYLATWNPGNPVRGLLAFFRALYRVLVEAGPERIVHVHMASRGSFYRKAALLHVARSRGARTVLHLHGAEFHVFVERASRLTRALVRGTYAMADRVVVLSEEWKRRVAEFSGRTDAVVIPNPVKIPSHAADFDGAPTVLLLGRLGERKGIPDLLEAIRILQDGGHTDVEWVLAGDGDVEGVRKQVAMLPCPQAVEVPGWVDQDEVERLLRRAWVFCLPSHNEGLPVSLLQAMASGVACVTTPVGGIPEYVHDGVTGCLVDPGDSRRLAEVLSELLADAAQCRRLGEAARRTVEGACAAESVAQRWVELYRGLVGETVTCP